VIAQQFISYRKLSRLRKSATAAGLSRRSCTVSCVGWFWQLNKMMFYRVWCHSTVMRGLMYVLKNWQWPERNWTSVAADFHVNTFNFFSFFSDYLESPKMYYLEHFSQASCFLCRPISSVKTLKTLIVDVWSILFMLILQLRLERLHKLPLLPVRDHLELLLFYLSMRRKYLCLWNDSYM